MNYIWINKNALYLHRDNFVQTNKNKTKLQLNHMDKQTKDERFEVYTKVVRAGKRTYYFDVKKTRNNDYYLTITESKRVSDNPDSANAFEKHKIFLYKEDFEKFDAGLKDVIDCIKTIKTTGHIPQAEFKSDFDQVDFDSI